MCVDIFVRLWGGQGWIEGKESEIVEELKGRGKTHGELPWFPWSPWLPLMPMGMGMMGRC